MTIKDKWINAYEKTLSEYQSSTHASNKCFCAKCQLIPYRCAGCPESVFATNSDVYGCVKRKIYARDSRPLMIKNGNQKQLVEYHKQAIELLKTIPAKKFHLVNFNSETFAGLKIIDKNIYDARNEIL